MPTLLSLAALGTLLFSPTTHVAQTRLIVRLKDPASMALARFGAGEFESKLVPGLRTISVPSDDAPAVLQALSLDDSIAYAERDFEIRIERPAPAEDPLLPRQWALEAIQAKRAWELSTGSEQTVVAVIDTGINFEHPDLLGQIWKNPGESGGGKETDGIDNDGNGFVDDVHGWNFDENNSNPVDENGHGTHCAGVIGAAHSDVGIRGVNARVRIMPVRFLSGAGTGTLEGALKATEYAIRNGAQVMSNSWGGPIFSQALEDLVAASDKAGIVYVAAAGNEHSNNDTEPVYPAAFDSPNVVAVAASDPKDQIAHFSNWGPKRVHLAAPGIAILSTYLGASYESLNGTSMAAPHVAGAAALLRSYRPTMSHLEIKAALISSSDRSTALEGRVTSSGRLNLYNLLAGVTPPPPVDPNPWPQVEHKLESPHPYPELAKFSVTLKHPGAKAIKIHFARLETEKRIDYIALKTGSGETIETLSGKQGALWSRTVPGDSVTLELRSDSENQFFGFEVDRYAYEP